MPRAFLLFVLGWIPFTSGCVLVSMHTTRPVEVRVTDTKTGQPIAGAPVNIQYYYTGYGVVWILHMPKPASAQTDDGGVAIIPMADFFQNIELTVDGEHFALNKQLIRHGGSLRGGYWGGNSQWPDGRPKGELVFHPSRVAVQLVPQN